MTETEPAITALVAQGHSNPEIATRMFVSPRSVETHVSHILTELQARSRLDITREVTLHWTAQPTS